MEAWVTQAEDWLVECFRLHGSSAAYTGRAIPPKSRWTRPWARLPPHADVALNPEGVRWGWHLH
eukprot:12884836-Prorocentrum_lima.AAC.1